MPRIGILFCLGLCLLAAPAAAQDRFEAMQYGVVVDEQDRPVPNVEVRGLWEPRFRSPYGPSLVVARTDEEGKFVVPLPAGEISRIELLASDGNGNAGYTKRGTTRIDEPVWQPAKVVLKSCRRYDVEVNDAEGNPSQGIQVSVMPEFLGDFVQSTDADGKATILAPSEFKSEAIVAWDKTRGMDYLAFDHFGEVQPGRISPMHTETVEMRLTPWKKYRLQVVDLDGKPLANTALTPEYVHLPQRLSTLPTGTLMTAYTNDEGWADVRIPETSLMPSILVQKPGYYTNKMYASSLNATVPVKMVPLVPVKGTILHPDGSPAEQVLVECRGKNDLTSGFNEFALSDQEGKFYIEVPGNSFCIIFAKTDDQAISPKHLVIRHNQPLEPVTVTLQPMTKVLGTLTDRNGQPLTSEKLAFYQTDGKSGRYFETLPVEQRLQNEPDSTSIFDSYYTKTDEKGKYEILLGRGQYELRLTEDSSPQFFDIDSEEPKPLDLRNDKLPKRVLKGRVVAAEGSNCRVANARVQGVAQSFKVTDKFYYSRFSVSSDANGLFEAKPFSHPYLVVVKSHDKKCQGMAFVPPNAEEFDILLAPPTKVTGTLVEQDGTPVANRPLTAVVEFDLDGEVHTAPATWSDTTDAQGRFEFTKLVAGQAYTVRILQDAQPGELGQRLEIAFHFTTEENGPAKDLGEIKRRTPPGDG